MQELLNDWRLYVKYQLANSIVAIFIRDFVIPGVIGFTVGALFEISFITIVLLIVNFIILYRLFLNWINK